MSAIPWKFKTLKPPLFPFIQSRGLRNLKRDNDKIYRVIHDHSFAALRMDTLQLSLTSHRTSAQSADKPCLADRSQTFWRTPKWNRTSSATWWASRAAQRIYPIWMTCLDHPQMQKYLAREPCMNRCIICSASVPEASPTARIWLRGWRLFLKICSEGYFDTEFELVLWDTQRSRYEALKIRFAWYTNQSLQWIVRAY